MSVRIESAKMLESVVARVRAAADNVLNQSEAMQIVRIEISKCPSAR